jgi:cobalt-zinc-cadmium efflux system protein
LSIGRSYVEEPIAVPVPEHGEEEAEARVLRALRLAVELSLVVLVIESVGAYFSRSLSVTVDAVHNVPDVFAFATSWAALRATERGISGPLTFGAHRFEVFAGLLNAVIVLGTGVAFGLTSTYALLRGSSFAGPVDAVWILLVAVPTLGIRSANLAILGRIPGRARDLNLRSVLLHLGGDLAITVALLAAGGLLLLRPGIGWVDGAAALAIAAILVYESLPLFRGAADVLSERVPRDLSLPSVERSILSVPGATGVHDLHVWAVCPTLVCMTAHVQVRDITVRQGMDVAAELRRRMAEEFGILHAVFELETERTDPAGAALRARSLSSA